MNPYYYLFYKINRVVNKNEDNEWGAIFGITVLIGWNFALIYNKTTKDDINSLDRHKPYLIGFIIVLFIINSILFSNRDRVSRIEARYKNESRTNKIIGGIIVIIYVIITSTAIFI